MRKIPLEFKLTISFIKEGNRVVAYSPALDLSTSGKNHSDARKRFEEIVSIFFEELIKNGTAKEALGNLGWKKTPTTWNPPIVISQESQTIRVPAI